MPGIMIEGMAEYEDVNPTTGPMTPPLFDAQPIGQECGS